jgi:hypothetical protein
MPEGTIQPLRPTSYEMQKGRKRSYSGESQRASESLPFAVSTYPIMAGPRARMAEAVI